MATIVMNADESEIAQGPPRAGEETQLAPAAEKPVAPRNETAKIPEPATDPDIALLTAPEEVDDIIGPLRSASFPSCP